MLVKFAPFPRVGERTSWQQLPQAIKEKLIQFGEGYLNYQWPTLPATHYMDYIRVGNRTRFEKLYFKRRQILATLVLAECVEAQGRFIDDLINGIWLICEESTWVLPAHNNHQALPNINDEIIDLFQAETGALLAWSDYLLKSVLDQESPLISQRIQDELQRRIIEPYLKNDYNWSRLANNWNTWINSNCLTVFLLTEMNHEQKLAGIEKILNSIDFFLAKYPADGGCDEGPFYWGRAAGSLFDLLEQLYLATAGNYSIYDRPIIKNIARYIYQVNIVDDYFVNFADSSGKIAIDAPVVYMFGKRIDDLCLCSLGARELQRQGIEGLMGAEILSLFRVLLGLFNYQEMITFAKENPRYYAPDVWLDRIQVMAAREMANSNQGFYLAAKGGYNQESHNHNDVGNFILYYNGEPVIIDVGVGEYTAKTFSEQRYDIWTMQSAYHNLPTISEIQQQAGSNYRAQKVSYSVNKQEVNFALDISSAYPKAANIHYWQRSYALKRTEQASLLITDQFKLNQAQEITLSFMLCKPVRVNDLGIIHFSIASNLSMSYDSNLFAVVLEEILISDQRLISVWGSKLYRLLLKTKKPVLSGDWTFVIEKIEQ
ncbi:MAG: heparinase [Firmicutes bacterium]|nr:heparinase [Bacillota bacterium]